MIDVRDPEQPASYGMSDGISIPAELGRIQKIERDPSVEDRLLVYTVDDVVVLDNTRLDTVTASGAQHPAVIDVIANIGTTHDSNGSTTFGVQVASEVSDVQPTWDNSGRVTQVDVAEGSSTNNYGSTFNYTPTGVPRRRPARPTRRHLRIRRTRLRRQHARLHLYCSSWIATSLTS
jgi:hypothetical protein